MIADASPSGYRMPAEWTPHDSTWLSWPHNVETWPERLDSVEAVMALAVRVLLEGEDVDINVLDAAHGEHVRAIIGTVSELPHVVRYHEIPTNDAWCRDHGAVFLTSRTDPTDRLATSWGYNAWGGKWPPYDLDRQVAGRMAEAVGVPVLELDMVLEGGSIEVDGRGRLMTTASCLLNPNRNPDLSQEEIEGALRSVLGVDEIIWLEGEIEGDDTDGHIDNLARFVPGGAVLVASEPGVSVPTHKGLRENVDRLREYRFADGTAPEVIPLPMPRAVYAGRDRLPASYCNYYIGNAVVLLPTYGCREDDVVAGILQSRFPNRRIVGLDCRDVVRGLGAFHCLTQQVPGSGFQVPGSGFQVPGSPNHE